MPRHLHFLTTPLDAPGIREPAARTIEELEDEGMAMREVVDRGMREVEAEGGMRARIALEGGICGLKLAVRGSRTRASCR